MSIFRNQRYGRIRATFFNGPRRPRNPLLRIALGVLGVALLLGLLFVSVFIGLAMLAVGMLWRLFKQRGKSVAAHADAIDGDYRVVGKAQLPLAH